MNNSTVNFTLPEESPNSTSQSIEVTEILSICVYSINLLVGLPTHSYVLWLIVTKSGAASAFINLNFSISEIVYCLNNLTSILAIIFSNLRLLPLFLQGLPLTGRPLFQSLMCVERYLAVVHPVTFLKYKPVRYRVICCSAAWILTIGTCFFCLFSVVSENLNINSRFFSLQSLFIFSIQLFCLVAVLRALKQSGPGERKREEDHMKRRAFYIILITTVSMVFIYVPFTVTGCLTFLSQYSMQGFWVIGLGCFVLAGFVQPVLYLHHAGKLSCLCSLLV